MFMHLEQIDAIDISRYFSICTWSWFTRTFFSLSSLYTMLKATMMMILIKFLSKWLIFIFSFSQETPTWFTQFALELWKEVKKWKFFFVFFYFHFFRCKKKNKFTFHSTLLNNADICFIKSIMKNYRVYYRAFEDAMYTMWKIYSTLKLLSNNRQSRNWDENI
jgi:hypothetical protein